MIKIIWEEVEKKYGKEIADKMAKSQYLQGITMKVKAICKKCGNNCNLIETKKAKCNNCGEIDDFTIIQDIYECDLDLAYRDIVNEFIDPKEWD